MNKNNKNKSEIMLLIEFINDITRLRKLVQYLKVQLIRLGVTAQVTIFLLCDFENPQQS